MAESTTAIQAEPRTAPNPASAPGPDRRLIDLPKGPMAGLTIWLTGPLLISIFLPELRIAIASGNLLPIAVIAGLWLAPLTVLSELGLRGRLFIVGGGGYLFGSAMLVAAVVSDLISFRLGAAVGGHTKTAVLIAWSGGLFLILDRRLALRLARCFVWVVLAMTLYELFDVLVSNASAVNIFQADLRSRNASAHSTLVALGLLAPTTILPRFSLLGGRRLDRFAMAILFAGITLSLSRGALISVILALLLLFARTRDIQRAAAATVGFTIVAAGLVMFVPEVMDRLETTFIIDLDSSAAAGVSNGTRLVAARIGTEIWLDNPVFGAGKDSYSEIFRDYLRPGDPDLDVDVQSPHNQYLHFFAESGAAVGLFFAAWVLSSTRKVLWLLRRRDSVDPLHLCLSFGWIPHAIYFLFSFPYERVSFWLFVALASWALGRAALGSDVVDLRPSNERTIVDVDDQVVLRP